MCFIDFIGIITYGVKARKILENGVSYMGKKQTCLFKNPDSLWKSVGVRGRKQCSFLKYFKSLLTITKATSSAAFLDFSF
jgi:hypothetical protein